jgi:protein-tyrosine phosphatase
MSEGILKDRIERKGLKGIRVGSAGTWGLEGEPAATHAVEVCRKRGIDISGHVARKLEPEMIEESDLVLTMEMEHLQCVLDLVPSALAKTRMLSRYGSVDGRNDRPIPDPYGLPRKAYERCFEELERHVDAFLEEMLSEGKGEREKAEEERGQGSGVGPRSP